MPCPVVRGVISMGTAGVGVGVPTVAGISSVPIRRRKVPAPFGASVARSDANVRMAMSLSALYSTLLGLKTQSSVFSSVSLV